MSLLLDAIRLTAEHGDDFWVAAALCAHQGGHVIIGPGHVLIARRESPDTLFIWLAMGEGYLPRLCLLAPPEIKWLRWQRALRFDDKARVGQFAFERIRRLASILPSCHELRTSPRTPANGRSGPDSAAAGHDHHRAKPVH